MRRFKVTKDIFDNELALQEDDGKWVLFTDHEAAIKQAVADERERCAIVAETHSTACFGGMYSKQIAEAVRQRGK